MFENRLEKAINNYNSNTTNTVQLDDIKKEISNFKKEYSNLLMPKIWDDKILDLKVNEFDMLLTIYQLLYVRASNALEKNKLIIWHNDERPFSIISISLFRFIIQDIITLRNQCIMKFENQFNAIFRNLIEKNNIFFLFMYDYYFSSNLAFNDKKYSEKDLYNKLMRPARIKERIKNNLAGIIQKEKEERVRYNSLDKSIYEFLLSETIEDVYGLSSLFVHHNNFQRIINYYIEENKINYSLKHNASNYLHYRLDYVIEILFWLYYHFNSAFVCRGG